MEKNIKSFSDFINEAAATGQTVTKVIDIEFDIDWNKNIGKVKDSFTLAMSPDSTGVFSLGEDVEKFSGLKLEEAKEYNETPDDAYIYGLCNIMNGGKDHYLWVNGTRLGGEASKVGVWPALFEILSHEGGVHLTRKLLTRAIAKNRGIDITNEDWIKADYGGGEYMWPASGDNEDKKNPIVIIDEEAFATACGYVVQQLTPHFLEMASAYIPQLGAAANL